MCLVYKSSIAVFCIIYKIHKIMRSFAPSHDIHSPLLQLMKGVVKFLRKSCRAIIFHTSLNLSRCKSTGWKDSKKKAWNWGVCVYENCAESLILKFSNKYKHKRGQKSGNKTTNIIITLFYNCNYNVRSLVTLFETRLGFSFKKNPNTSQSSGYRENIS